MRSPARPPHGRAVVIGGSIAGLCAARVLSDFFREVFVVERDRLPDGPHERPGVPQSRHIHALLIRGRRELEALFPGFEAEMRQQGALELEFSWDFAVLQKDGWLPRARLGLRTLFASRNLIEAVVRDLARKLPRVRFLENTRVVGLRFSPGDPPRVTGVVVSEGPGNAPRPLDAELVVDASGRGTRVPAWLDRAGLRPPEEDVVDAHAAYATRWYRAPSPELWPREWWWKGIWIDPVLPHDVTAAVLSPVEGHRWVVTLGGLARLCPPDEKGFAEKLGRLRSPILARAVALGEPESPLYHNHAMANRFRLYHRWAHAPAGFVAIGDSVCSFNPIYGQGMTCAALSARALADCLRKHETLDRDFSRAFFATQARVLRDPWLMATGADFHLAETTGKRPRGIGFFNAYTDLLFEAMRDDLFLRRRIGEVVHMLRPPSALFTPRVLRRVLPFLARRKAGTLAAGGLRRSPSTVASRSLASSPAEAGPQPVLASRVLGITRTWTEGLPLRGPQEARV
ncbi:MAG: hypothetical protein KatS3mg076_3208 [Candidatus Binatia bacterium]|nr:MAG: hypothetical protein KatS3mg076_3208 [Candidatus Binatia bacterium]